MAHITSTRDEILGEKRGFFFSLKPNRLFVFLCSVKFGEHWLFWLLHCEWGCKQIFFFLVYLPRPKKSKIEIEKMRTFLLLNSVCVLVVFPPSTAEKALLRVIDGLWGFRFSFFSLLFVFFSLHSSAVFFALPGVLSSNSFRLVAPTEASPSSFRRVLNCSISLSLSPYPHYFRLAPSI